MAFRGGAAEESEKTGSTKHTNRVIKMGLWPEPLGQAPTVLSPYIDWTSTLGNGWLDKAYAFKLNITVCALMDE